MKILRLKKVTINLHYINFIRKSLNITFARIVVFTHHNPRSNPKMTGFNLGCIDSIDTFDLKNIIINDGNNHPLDKK